MRHLFPLILGLSAVIGAASAAGCASAKAPNELGSGGDGGDFGGVGSGNPEQGIGTPASQCLDNINCADNSDCPNGYRCNGAISPPQCQKLYCGQAGSLCNNDHDCSVGLFCLGTICGTPCVYDGETCGGSAQCCSGVADCIEGRCDSTTTAAASATASEAAAATSSSSGGGSCSTCVDYALNGIGDGVCPGPAEAAYEALVTCICDPSNCATDCAQSCSGQGADTLDCPACEETAASGACSVQLTDCEAN